MAVQPSKNSPSLTTMDLNRVYAGFYKQVKKTDLLATDASAVAVHALTENGDFISRLIGEGRRRLPQTSNELAGAMRKVREVTLGTLQRTMDSGRIATLSVAEKREARVHVETAFRETLKLTQRRSSLSSSRGTASHIAAMAATPG